MFEKKKINALEKELNRTKAYLKDAREMLLALQKESSKYWNEYLQGKQDMRSYYESVILNLRNSYKNREDNLLAEMQKKDKEIKRLKNELKKAPKRLSQIDLDNLREEMKRNVWEGKERDVIFIDANGYPVLKLHGHSYEPSYESFDFTCMVVGYDSYGKEYVLFDEDARCIEPYRNQEMTIGSEEKIKNYIKEKDRYVTEKE